MFLSLEFKENIQVEYLKEANHTFTFLAARGQLLTTIEEWMKTHFQKNVNSEKEVISEMSF